MSVVKCRHPYTKIMVIAVISERDETDGGQVQLSFAKLLSGSKEGCRGGNKLPSTGSSV